MDRQTAGPRAGFFRLREGDAHELLGCVAIIRQTAAAIDRQEYWDGQGEGLQLVAGWLYDLSSRMMEEGL